MPLALLLPPSSNSTPLSRLLPAAADEATNTIVVEVCAELSSFTSGTQAMGHDSTPLFAGHHRHRLPNSIRLHCSR